jgi:hypothetical protein
VALTVVDVDVIEIVVAEILLVVDSQSDVPIVPDVDPL